MAWTNAHAPCSRAKPRGRRSGMAPECALAMTYMRDARCEMRDARRAQSNAGRLDERTDEVGVERLGHEDITFPNGAVELDG